MYVCTKLHMHPCNVLSYYSTSTSTILLGVHSSFFSSLLLVHNSIWIFDGGLIALMALSCCACDIGLFLGSGGWICFGVPWCVGGEYILMYSVTTCMVSAPQRFSMYMYVCVYVMMYVVGLGWDGLEMDDIDSLAQPWFWNVLLKHVCGMLGVHKYMWCFSRCLLCVVQWDVARRRMSRLL